MANNITVTMSLEDRGKSIQKRTQEAQGLNHELEKTTKLASQALRSQPKAAGFAGEVTSYGIERGATGRTGASARDFANEAQGLGGLVRLYATYAANVFAVSAAFTALRDAMNTDMMIRGLDQLGAAGGVALGGLAKQFSAVTDGAISLRESMESTAKAISSGLSQQQFLELGKVAKGASQALGVNMSDAVSRLTRGITKLEPELLDELGIFTKVGKATEDYAKSVGKSVTSLTDFERRQAFANAVLEEGRQKFGEIAMESNPYDQLLASLKDVAQNILSVVNTVVAPIAKLLADNVALIGAAIAAAGLKIVNQALPALGQWQKGLATAAADAAAKASEIQESFGETWVAKAESRAGIPQLTAELEDAQQKLRQIEKERLDLAKQTSAVSTGYKNTSKALSLLKADEALTEQQIASLMKEKTRTENLSTKNAVLQADAIKRRIDLEKESVNLNKQIADLQSRRESAFRQVGEQAERPDIGEWSRAQISRDAQVRAARLSLISGVAANVEKSGLGSLTKFFEDVDNNAALAGKTFEKLKTKGTGALIGIATSARIAGSALLSFLSGPLQVAILAFTVLDMVFSKNSKQVSEFTSQLDLNSESLKTASNVLEKYGNTLSIESINARANAFTSVSDSVNTLTKSLEEADKAASWFDKYVVDAFKDLFGFGLADKYRENLANSIFQAIQEMPVGEARSRLESKLKTIVGTSDLSISGLTKAIDKVPTNKLVQFGKEASTALNIYGRSLKDAQAYTQDILTSQKALEESLTAVARSGAKLTEYDKALESISKSVAALRNSFNNTTSASVVFGDILSGKVNISILDVSSALSTLENARAFKTLQQQANGLENQVRSIQKEYEKAANVFFGPRRGTEFRRSATQTDSSYLIELRKSEETLKRSLDNIRKEQQSYLQSQVQILSKASAQLAENQIAQFQSKLSTIGIQGELSRLSKSQVTTKHSIDRRSKLEQALINSQASLVEATNRSIIQQESNRLAIIQQTKAMLNDARQKALASGDTDLAKKIGAQLNELGYVGVDISAIQSALSRADARALASNPYVSDAAKSAAQAIQLNRSEASIRKEDVRITAEQEKIRVRYEKVFESLDAQIGSIANKMQITTDATEKENLVLDDTRLQLQKLAEEFNKSIAIEGAVYGKNIPPDIVSKLQNQFSQSAQKVLGTTQTASQVSALDANKAAQALIRSLQDQDLLTKAKRDSELQSLDIQEQQLSRSLELGVISEKSYQLQIQQIAARKTELELQNRLDSIARESQSKLSDISEKMQLPGLGEKEKEELVKYAEQIAITYGIAKDGALSWADAQNRANRVLTESEQRTKNFNEFGKNLFEGFGNAIVDFAQTGKWSFGDMVKSMIADLARLEMKMQMTKLYDASGGLGNLLTSVIPSMFGATPVAGTISNGMSQAQMLAAQTSGFASGGAFDSGLLKFAKGGAFTNQIVNTPTQFKFAQGAGIMGEAGPEAIMPLQRDNRGNLGVRAQGGGTKVDVVVNNYSTEKAEAKEVVDSRGNRRIEVTVGEMVAAEVSRSNSPVNQSIKNSFGTKPALIRR